MGIRKHRKKKLSTDQLKASILKYFAKNPKKRLNAGQLIKKLDLKNNRDSVASMLDQLNKEDFIRPVSEFKFVLNKRKELPISKENSSETYVGKVDMIRSGSAYVSVVGLDKDVYIPARHLASAQNKDEVEIVVKLYKNKNPEGRVIKVLKRNTSRVIGILRSSKSSGIVHFSSKKSEFSVYITPKNFGDAKDGDKVMVEILSWGNDASEPIWGKVIKILNDLDQHNFTMESILVENGFSSDYPEEVLKELEAYNDIISQEEIDNRRDFRDVLCFTIDPDTAQDFDDAISYRILEDGSIELGVHIADVTHYLKEGSALDKEAFNRSTSVYLVDRCIAMLPEKLSNNLCSLIPHKDRLVFSAVFIFDKKLKLKSEWFGKSIIHSDHRFTYEEAQESLDNEGGLFHDELKALNEIAYKLRDQRFKNGGIAFETDELKFELDENNKPISVFVKERKDVHLLIEDFMLLANRRVAEFMALKSKSKPVPFVYRIHDLPDIDRLQDLKLLLQEYDVTLDLSSPDQIAKSFNTLSEKAQKEDKYKLLMSFAIRTMAKAIYSTENIGHYGLRFEYYTHFTSPIRRYSDVLVHRLLERNLYKEYRTDLAKLESMCVHISSQERRAMDAERDSIKYKQVEYIKDHEGEEFDGMVSGMIDKGIFVEISDTKAEGLISFDQLNDSYIIKDSKIKALSTRRGRDVKLGDKLRVKVIKADLTTRQIEMQFIDFL